MFATEISERFTKLHAVADFDEFLTMNANTGKARARSR
jgi:hypothetical protein